MATTDELLQEIETYKQALGDYQNMLNSVSFDKASDNLLEKFSTIGKAFKSLTDSTKELRIDTSSAVTSLDRVASGFGKILALTTNFDAFSNMKVEGGLAASTMISQFDNLTNRFNNWGEAAKKLAGSVPTAILQAGKGATRAWLEAASNAEMLENTYLNLQAATGNLDKEFTQAGGIDKLNERTAAFSKQLLDTSASTGMSSKEIGQYVQSLGTIPGAFDQVIKTGEGAGQQMSGLIGVMRLASGAHRDVSEVIGAMKTAYEKLGNPQGKVSDNTQKGAQLFAMMTEASQKLNLRFADTEDYLSQIADTFKHVGDNTEGATNVLARFSGALQSTGLTAKASIDIVQNMVKSLSNLEMGTKSLISMRSGGPGGLQGAFRVENLLRQGKVDDVAKMLEQTLKQQFGGRIYTQEEAANSPQAASQFMRQRTLLQSGVFGGLARNSEDATRLLEALKKGPEATASSIKDSMSAVKQTTERGNELQNRQYSAFNKMNNSMDRLVFFAQERFMIDAREALGTGNRGGEFEQSIQKYRNLVTDEATNDTQMGPYNDFKQYERQAGRESIADLTSSTEVIPNVKDFAVKQVQGVKDGMSQIFSDVGQKLDTNVKNLRIKRDQEDTNAAVQRGEQARKININDNLKLTRRIPDTDRKNTVNKENVTSALQLPRQRPTNRNNIAPAIDRNIQEKGQLVGQDKPTEKPIINRQNIQNITQVAMQQTPHNLRTQIPKASEVMKHEVAVEPVEVNIKVEADQGLKVQTVSTNKPGRTNIEINNNVAYNGGILQSNR